MQNTFLSSMITFYERDLARLKKEIEAYNQEENMWKVSKDISNCGGNLCLHLIGNLNAFIGSELGYTGYVRKRDEEFSLKNVLRPDLIDQIEETKQMITKALEGLDGRDLQEEYPLQVFKFSMTIEYFLIHLLAHLNYHLGQINYHRRLLDENK